MSQLFGHAGTCTVPAAGGGHDLFDRPPQVARYELDATGGRFNVINNHWKSMRDGEKVTEPIRTAQAAHVCAVVNYLRAAEPDVPVLVLGDLNSKLGSAPIEHLKSCAGLVDHWSQVPEHQRYSFIHGGKKIVLDHILTTRDIDPVAFRPVHIINVDYPTPPTQRGTCAPGDAHERASDHDPVFMRIDYAQLPRPGFAIVLPIALQRMHADQIQSLPERPLVRITALKCHGTKEAQSDEYVEMTNWPLRSVELTGWLLLSKAGMQPFWFSDGAEMQPSEVCRSTLMRSTRSRVVSTGGSLRPIWNDKGDTACLYDAEGRLVDCMDCDSNQNKSACRTTCPIGPPVPATSSNEASPDPVATLAPPPTRTPGAPGVTPTVEPTPDSTATMSIIPTVTSTPVQSPSPSAAAGQPPRVPLRIDTVFDDGVKGRSEPDEFVQLTNTSTDTVDLTGWELISVHGDQRYAFPGGATIDPAQTCRVYTNEQHDVWCGFNWGRNQALWRNTGDKAELRDPSGTLVDWFCYGNYAGECG